MSPHGRKPGPKPKQSVASSPELPMRERTCVLDGEKFDNYESYQFHLDQNHTEVLIKRCKFCPFESRQREVVFEHMYQCHSMRPLLKVIPCTHCHNFKATSLDLINFHIQSQQPVQQQSSPTPEKSVEGSFRIVPEKSSPTKIVLSRSMIRIFCHICDFSTMDRSQFGEHLATNHLMLCSLCRFSTVSEDLLKNHMQVVHKDAKDQQQPPQSCNDDEDVKSSCNSESLSKRKGVKVEMGRAKKAKKDNNNEEELGAGSQLRKSIRKRKIKTPLSPAEGNEVQTTKVPTSNQCQIADEGANFSIPKRPRGRPKKSVRSSVLPPVQQMEESSEMSPKRMYKTNYDGTDPTASKDQPKMPAIIAISPSKQEAGLENGGHFSNHTNSENHLGGDERLMSVASPKTPTRGRPKKSVQTPDQLAERQLKMDDVSRRDVLEYTSARKHRELVNSKEKQKAARGRPKKCKKPPPTQLTIMDHENENQEEVVTINDVSHMVGEGTNDKLIVQEKLTPKPRGRPPKKSSLKEPTLHQIALVEEATRNGECPIDCEKTLHFANESNIAEDGKHELNKEKEKPAPKPRGRPPKKVDELAKGPEVIQSEPAEIKPKRPLKTQEKITKAPFAKSSSAVQQYLPVGISRKMEGKKCLDCGYNGLQRYDTIRHVLNVHLKTRFFSCNECHFSSLYLLKLKNHYSAVHQGDEKVSPLPLAEIKIIKIVHSPLHLDHEEFKESRLKRSLLCSKDGNLAELRPVIKRFFMCPHCSRFKSEIRDEFLKHLTAFHDARSNAQIKGDDTSQIKKTEGEKLDASYDRSECLSNPVVEEDEKWALRQLITDDGRKCILCRFEAEIPLKLQEHISSSHVGTTNVSCLSCKWNSPNWTALVEHMKEKHVDTFEDEDNEDNMDEWQFACLKCKLKFPTEEILKEHFKKSHATAFKCALCQFSTCSDQALIQHVTVKHSNQTINDVVTELKCPLCCQFEGEDHVDLSGHLRKAHAKEIGSKCCYCQDIRSTTMSVMRHIDTVHLNIRKYPCTICSHRFTCSRDLKKHLHLHSLRS